jgi:hypothetical protein
MTTPLVTPNGDGYDIQPAGVMLILADMVYGPQDDPEWTGGTKTEAAIQDMLGAARAGGYIQTDILHTLLVRGERSMRIHDMARAACAAAGPQSIQAISDDMRKAK